MARERSGMPLLRRRLLTALVLLAGVAGAVGLLAGPGGGASGGTGSGATVASHTRHSIGSMFQDDRELVYSSSATVAHTLDTLRAFGVDQVRITVLWSAIAPDATSTSAPAGFAPTDPSSYPAAAWAPYDRVAELARARGIAVDFDLTAPGPLWAMQSGAPLAKEADHYYPLASSFEHFVIAIGRRYSGSFTPVGAHAPLPRVRFWSVWNEPNQPGWLAPQSLPGAGGPVYESARLYRGYVDAAYTGLGLTGHHDDTFLIGELAPEGDEHAGVSQPIPPIPFLRALYCVGPDDRPLSSVDAVALDCPAGSPAAFVSAHPGLFQATGFAHHPYSFFLAPTATMSDPNFVPLSDLSRIEQRLGAIFTAYGVHRQLPLYLTEYGYETNPPNPYRGVSPATQAAYLDQAEYLAWSDPRVRTLSQFELDDSAPDTSFPRGSVGYWSTFQTGLAFLDGRHKPSYASYPLPIYLPATSFRRGEHVIVWGMLRAARNGTAQRARLQWRPAGGGGWRTIDVLSTSNRTGVIEVRVGLPGSGAVRLAWSASGSEAAAATSYSRAVDIQVAP